MQAGSATLLQRRVSEIRLKNPPRDIDRTWRVLSSELRNVLPENLEVRKDHNLPAEDTAGWSTSPQQEAEGFAENTFNNSVTCRVVCWDIHIELYDMIITPKVRCSDGSGAAVGMLTSDSGAHELN